MSRSSASRFRRLLAWSVVAATAAASGAGLRAGADRRIQQLVREGEDLAYLEAFAPARHILERAVRTAILAGDPGLAALAIDRLALVHEFEGRNTEGIRGHDRAARMARNVGNRALTASILASAGLGDWRRGDYPAAIAALQQAASIQTELDDRAGLTRTLVFTGRVHFKKGEYAQALASYRAAMALLDSGADHRWRSIALEDLGDLHAEQGEFVGALDAFEQARAGRHAASDARGEVYMLSVIGRTYLLQGAYELAGDWFDRALTLATSIGDRPGRAQALDHLGIVRSSLGDSVGALSAYAEARALKVELGDRRGEAWVLMRMGDAWARAGDAGAAIERYQRATSIWQEIQDPRGAASGLMKAAAASLDRGTYREAAALFGRAGELRHDGHPVFLAEAMAGVARAYAAGGDRAAALDHARRAADLARRSSDAVQWPVLRSLASIEQRFGLSEEALTHYRESIGAIERVRTRVVPSADVRAGFLEGKQGVYAATIDLLAELGRTEEALVVAERARARAFLDDLSAARALPSNRGDTRLPVAEPPSAAAIKAEARRRGDTLLEYFSSADRLHMWVVGPRGAVRGTSVGIGAGELSGLVDDLRRALRVDEGPYRPSDAGGVELRQRLRRLHQLLIGPIANWLPRDPHGVITIVPHGPLFLLSFAALLDADGRYLVERHSLGYAPSFGVLAAISRSRDGRGNHPRLLVLGNPHVPAGLATATALPPLPGADREAAAVTRLFSSRRATAITRREATESRLRHLAPAYDIIHLATHAVIAGDRAADTYLVLASDTETRAVGRDRAADGLLTVPEIYQMRLTADLVTLSACDTGLGRVSGDGVTGLSRAFIRAGAASVLVSLWRVSDAVATIQMERFYREWIRNGGNKATAVAAAQRHTLRLLRAGEIRSPTNERLIETPLLWAAFVLVGDSVSRGTDRPVAAGDEF